MTGRVVVIGAGMGGLAAAALLQARGADVTLVEAAPEVGGKAGTASSGAVRFDTGPSLLTLPGVLDAVFRAAGTRLADRVELRELAPAFEYRFADGTRLPTWPDRARTLASVRAALGARAAGELERFLGYAERIWVHAAPPFVLSDAPSIRGMLGMDLRTLLTLRHIDVGSTLLRAIDKRVSDPRVRTLLMRFATYNGSDVRRAPATLACIAHVDLGLGAWGVTGGMNAVARALADVARERGAAVELGVGVARLALSRGRVRGVRLSDGRELAADAVVSNADVRHLFSDLLPVPSKADRAAAPSMSAHCWVFGTSRADHAPHTVLFPADYDAEFADVFDRGRVPTDPTVYACDQALTHGRERDADGRAPLFAMVNAPAVPATRALTDHEALTREVRRRLTGAGLLDERDPLWWSRTPAELSARFPGSGGSIYGAASNSALAAFARPSNAVPDVPGLFLATGSAHPGGGVPMALLSGMAAARAAARRLRLPTHDLAVPVAAVS